MEMSKNHSQIFQQNYRMFAFKWISLSMKISYWSPFFSPLQKYLLLGGLWNSWLYLFQTMPVLVFWHIQHIDSVFLIPKTILDWSWTRWALFWQTETQELVGVELLMQRWVLYPGCLGCQAELYFGCMRTLVQTQCLVKMAIASTSWLIPAYWLALFLTTFPNALPWPSSRTSETLTSPGHKNKVEEIQLSRK